VTLPPFQNLVDEHWRDVARLAHALAGPDEAEDVAQQAWAQALAAYPRLRSSTNLHGWLMTVTSRCAIDAHRSRARRAVPVAEVPEPTAAGGPGGAGPPPPGTTPPDANLPETTLWDVVRCLPVRQRQAVALRYVADLDHAQVARALGTTPVASRRLVSDALATLRSVARDRLPDLFPVPLDDPAVTDDPSTAGSGTSRTPRTRPDQGQVPPGRDPARKRVHQ
jgi:RNA polymerase sigma factor (sigma-70 family)